MALLDLVVRCRDERSLALSAIHVHHGLSPHADRWAAFCTGACAERDVPLRVVRVQLTRRGGESLEALAREARYDALARHAGQATLALAHHADDQVETVLLQLMRGAGSAGLAAMPEFSPGMPARWRPLLTVRRSLIDAYVAAEGIAHIEDESNADPDLRRNFLRAEILPRLEGAFPGWVTAVGRAARHQATNERLLAVLASMDAGPAGLATPSLEAIGALDPGRQANVLRAFLAAHGLGAPSAARLGALRARLPGARTGTELERFPAGATIVVQDGRLRVVRRFPAAFEQPWTGESIIDLPGGRLEFLRGVQPGVAAARLPPDSTVVRSRRGGERLATHPGGPTRMLVKLFQEHRIPAAQRAAWPLVYTGGRLVAIPGIAIDPGALARDGEPAIALRWHPS